MERLLIVPAAGTGSRLGLPLPKLLVPVAGRAMIDHVLALYTGLVDRALVVVQPSVLADARRHLASSPVPVDCVVQPAPSGMLDAILLASPSVERWRPRRIWITWCDQIALLPKTLQALKAVDDAVPEPPLALPTCRTTDPYVHIDRNVDGRITGVRHVREGDAMPRLGETDAGLFDLSLSAYLDNLRAYAAAPSIGARTGERNFVPFVAWMASRGPVVTIPCSLPEEAIGVNTRQDLETIEAHLRTRVSTFMTRPTLSIVIPAYNEERYIGTLLNQIEAVNLASLGVDKQVIVVDDCSKDRTAEIVSGFSHVILERMPTNEGKGRAVRAGMELATGEYLIIQDADLEYDPQDYIPMMEALLTGCGDIVYGSRYLGRGRHEKQSLAAYLGGRSLSFVALACTGTYLTDTVTALKLFPRDMLMSLTLTTSGFELDHEITAKMLAQGRRIVEVPVRYYPRSREEGKKIGMKDWYIGCRTFFRFRNG